MKDSLAIVYRCPGPHWGPPGTTYDSRGVADQDELAAHLEQGWHSTLAQAAAAFLNPPVPVLEASAEPVVGEIVTPADDAPPTREEMEAKARELGVKFDGRTSDARLLAKIDDALGAAPAPTPTPDPASADNDPI